MVLDTLWRTVWNSEVPVTFQWNMYTAHFIFWFISIFCFLDSFSIRFQWGNEVHFQFDSVWNCFVLSPFHLDSDWNCFVLSPFHIDSVWNCFVLSSFHFDSVWNCFDSIALWLCDLRMNLFYAHSECLWLSVLANSHFVAVSNVVDQRPKCQRDRNRGAKRIIRISSWNRNRRIMGIAVEAANVCCSEKMGSLKFGYFRSIWWLSFGYKSRSHFDAIHQSLCRLLFVIRYSLRSLLWSQCVISWALWMGITLWIVICSLDRYCDVAEWCFVVNLDPNVQWLNHYLSSSPDPQSLSFCDCLNADLFCGWIRAEASSNFFNCQ